MKNAKDKRISVPFKDGHISTDDLLYIIENKIECTEIAKYTDGWYYAFSLWNYLNIMIMMN